MLYILSVVLFGLWGAGLATSNTFEGMIHMLLVISIIVALIALIRGNAATRR